MRFDGLRVAYRFFQHTGLLEAVRPAGVLRFVAGLRRGSVGPHQVVRFHRYNTPMKEALVFEGRRYNYTEFAERARCVGRGLRVNGVRPGDSVAMLLGNTCEFMETQIGCFDSGATAVSVGYRLKASEVAYILEDAECRALVFDHSFRDVALEAARLASTPLLVVVGGNVGGARSYEDIVAAGVDSTATNGTSAGGMMVYTSGTTGKPKGAHRMLADLSPYVAMNCALQFPLAHDERHLAVCPLYHSAAPAFIGLTYLAGGTSIIMRKFDPEQALHLIQQERCTSSAMVPTMLSAILALPAATRARYDISSMRWIMAVAAPLPTSVARATEEYFGPVLYNMYGATETGFVTVARPGEHTARPGTIGRVVPGNEIRLYDEAGKVVTPGAVGEIFVRNTMLMGGYFRNRAATQEASRDGFISVGDLGRFDMGGFLYLVDRKTDMVISGGVNIYPLEIEQCLDNHPAVKECAVIGVPDEKWGERLEAFVTLHKGASVGASELELHCRDHLADFKRPRRFNFVDALPRNPTGKVLKRQLRQEAHRAGP